LEDCQSEIFYKPDALPVTQPKCQSIKGKAFPGKLTSRIKVKLKVHPWALCPLK